MKKILMIILALGCVTAAWASTAMQPDSIKPTPTDTVVKRIIRKITILRDTVTPAPQDSAVAAVEVAQDPKKPIVRKAELRVPHPEYDERVIVGRDTVPLVVRSRNFGRYDRGLFNYLYIPKGSWAFGLTASYAELGTDDLQLLSVLKDVDFIGKMYSIKPSVSYFFKNNQSLGLQFNIQRGEANLGSLMLDIDEDMNFSLHDVSYLQQKYSMSVVYRNYVGLSRDKRFAVFNDVAIDMGHGTSEFKRYYGDELKYTQTTVNSVNFNFSPGVCVFMHDMVAFNVSFGVFGLHLQKETQQENGISSGSRFSSGANFKFNIFNINFGLMVVI